MKGLHFHKMPRNKPKLLKQWLVKMKRKDPPLTKSSKICSIHFESDCYERDLRSQLLNSKRKFILKEDAVPTIFHFSSFEKVSDVSSTSLDSERKRNQNKLRKERLHRRRSNKDLQKVCGQWE